MKIFFKSCICFALSLFGSDVRLNELKNKFKGGRVLLIGDGVSQIYALDLLGDYDHIIAVNQSSPLNQKLQNKKQICHIMMEPSFTFQVLKAYIFPRRDNKWMRSAPSRFGDNRLGFLVLHPYGAILKKLFFPRSKILFCSPYSKVGLENKDVYGDFTAAFQVALGMAVTLGFKDLDIVGFDAWLLTPKNAVRWYSEVENHTQRDVDENTLAPPEFLSVVARHCNLRTFIYGHYSSRYDFIPPINTPQRAFPYIPGMDRRSYMSNSNYLELRDWERINFPGGYEG